jgi:phenylacetate-coenzyme A ligase PaaK-like adenylate-forming protein
MSTIRRRQRLADFALGLREARQAQRLDAVVREALLAEQRARLDALWAFACERSAFYRDRSPAQTLDKATLMEHYDDALTDPGLSLARLEAHADALSGDELLDGEYRVMASGGTTGRRMLVAQSRAEWRTSMSGFFRWKAITGRKPRPRLRLAVVTAGAPQHMSWRFLKTVDVGLLNILLLSAELPPERLVAEVRAFRPHELGGYPTAIAVLANEQLDGRLDIAPEFVGCTSEVLTPDVVGVMQDAWGVTPSNMYAITESGIVASECEHQCGLHVFEDHTMVEVLDDDGAPAPDGELGRLVVTPLHARTLPLIRYEMGDLVRATREPCACGRPYLRLLEIQGRQDDVLELPARAGGTLRLHPIALRSPMATVPGLAEYQLVRCGDRLRARVALRDGAEAGRVTGEARTRLRAALTRAGAAIDDVDVEVVDACERSPMGKHRLVVAEASP